MEFRLIYRGPLHGQHAKSEHKSEIRKALHPQLERLWSLPPLAHMHELLEWPVKPSKVSVVIERCGQRFAPLVTTNLHLYAELSILICRDQPGGSLITDGGDIDNRLKTLLDALRVPRGGQESRPAGNTPGDPGLFYCLLEDDSLVSKVAIEAEQLLTSVEPDHVLAIIHVLIKKTASTWNNSNF